MTLLILYQRSFVNRTTWRAWGHELKTEGLSIGKPLPHFPRAHCSIIPVFQHSKYDLPGNASRLDEGCGAKRPSSKVDLASIKGGVGS